MSFNFLRETCEAGCCGLVSLENLTIAGAENARRVILALITLISTPVAAWDEVWAAKAPAESAAHHGCQPQSERPQEDLRKGAAASELAAEGRLSGDS